MTLEQKYWRSLMCGAAVWATTGSAAMGQGAPQGFSLGLSVLSSNGIYAGEGNDAQILPLLSYDSDTFSLGLPDGVRVTAYEEERLRASVLVSPRLSEIDGSSAAELSGLGRTLTFDAGVLAQYEVFDDTGVSLRAVTELTGEHGGSEIELAFEQGYFGLGLPIFVSGGMTWQSSELSSYLYGVRASEARAGRAAYDPGDTLTPFIGVFAALPVSENGRIVANIEATFLPDEVTSSPIIDEEMGLSAFIGTAYTF